MDYGNIRSGNIVAGNYTEMESRTGFLAHHGSARAWKDSMVPAGGFRGGVTSLTFDTLTTNLWGYRFDVNDEIYGVVQFNHDICVNCVVSPHIHLINKNAIGNTNYNVGVEFTYIWASIGQVFAAENVPTVIDYSFQNVAALTHKVYDIIADITPTASQGGISSIMYTKVKRVAATTQNYSTNDIWIGGFDVHFILDTQGSRYEYLK